MLVLAACVLALASPLVAGRWPAGLLLNKWTWPLLIWATLIFQTVVLIVDMPHNLAAALHVASYAAAIGFLWLNRHFPGVYFVGAGALSNGVTIALNGGTLPASADAVAPRPVADFPRTSPAGFASGSRSRAVRYFKKRALARWRCL